MAEWVIKRLWQMWKGVESLVGQKLISGVDPEP